ncbi:MAG: cysteine desulfurase [Phormidesmis priestleyi Ana]|uniref:cysteine desulfurase n=1 Tax=Phormidesmis priestleyi Ana TaxID=1666911 RepID=A0A0P8DDR9_9CYAN|nr:MAG: cysteine desulfurase [Phormidesmis priestleyi Ana]
MQVAMQQHWGNASSLHDWGNRSATALERSRQQVADLINASVAESIIFTGGGSEANNLAIFGVAKQFLAPQHLIISAVEHSAITEPARQLERQGWQVTRLPVDRSGALHPKDLQAALRPNTVLVSIIYGQSEVGTLQPVAELGKIARAHGSLFHTDAVQVAGRLPINVQQLPVDFLSLSSHKIYGPQGAGALYVSPHVSSAQLLPIIYGGGQERGLRSGTQAIANIVGFGVAAELAAAEMPTETLRLIRLRDRLFALLKDVPGLVPTGDSRHRLPHHVSFCLAEGEVTGKTLVRQMNLAGIGISAGSACHSGKLSPSPILQAMGFSDRPATSGIRLTLGRHTAEADIDWTALVLQQVLSRTLAASSLATPTANTRDPIHA